MFAGSLGRESARAWKQQGGVHASNQSCIDHKSGVWCRERPDHGQERLYNDGLAARATIRRTAETVDEQATAELHSRGHSEPTRGEEAQQEMERERENDQR